MSEKVPDSLQTSAGLEQDLVEGHGARFVMRWSQPTGSHAHRMSLLGQVSNRVNSCFRHLLLVANRFYRRINLRHMARDLINHGATSAPVREHHILGVAEVHD